MPQGFERNSSILKAQKFINDCVSFYAKASSARNLLINFLQNAGVGGSGVGQTPNANRTLTTSWQRFTATFNIPSITGATLGTGHYLTLRFMFADSGNGSIDIARVQVEKGTVATEFETRQLAFERFFAIRYYRLFGKGMTGGWQGATLAGFGVVLQPPMRAACSLSLNDTTPIIEEVGVADRTGTASIISASSISADGMWFRINGFTGATAGNPAISKEDNILTCDAEL